MINFLHSFIPNPIAFTIGSFAIHWYGLFLLVAIVLGYWLVSLDQHHLCIVFDASGSVGLVGTAGAHAPSGGNLHLLRRGVHILRKDLPLADYISDFA